MMQRPKQEGLGAAFGGDTMADLAGAKASDMLEKATGFLAVLFFGVTIALSILWNVENPTKLLVPESKKMAMDDAATEETAVASEEAMPVAETNDVPAEDVAVEDGEVVEQSEATAEDVVEAVSDSVEEIDEKLKKEADKALETLKATVPSGE